MRCNRPWRGGEGERERVMGGGRERGREGEGDWERHSYTSVNKIYVSQNNVIHTYVLA